MLGNKNDSTIGGTKSFLARDDWQSRNFGVSKAYLYSEISKATGLRERTKREEGSSESLKVGISEVERK